MILSPEIFARSIADTTRLRILALLQPGVELCVCDLISALELPQPKISRHLAILRESGILLDRRAGVWIHYRLHPELASWVLDALSAMSRGCVGMQPFTEDRRRLEQGGHQPMEECG